MDMHPAQLIREANKAKRKKSCETQIKSKEKFEDVIFKTESMSTCKESIYISLDSSNVLL